MLCKHDFTFRRYQSVEETEKKLAKNPKVYRLQDIEYISKVSWSSVCELHFSAERGQIAIASTLTLCARSTIVTRC